jgi:hypothetical protein
VGPHQAGWAASKSESQVDDARSGPVFIFLVEGSKAVAATAAGDRSSSEANKEDFLLGLKFGLVASLRPQT